MKKNIYLLFMTVFTIVFAYSTSILLWFFDIQEPKVSYNTLSNYAVAPKYCIDYMTYNGGFFKTAQFNGWAFATGTPNNRNHYTNLFLKSKDKLYQISTINIIKSSLNNTFEDKNIDMSYYGFYTNFSIIPIKNGIYQLYIYASDNKESQGAIPTGQWYEKTSDSFKKCKFNNATDPQAYSTPMSNTTDWKISKDSVVKDDSKTSWFDIAKVDNDVLHIRGWIFNEDEDASDDTVFIELRKEQSSKFYTTVKNVRRGVAELFKNNLYLQSGYIANIPISDLQDGEYSIYVYCCSKNGSIIGGYKKNITIGNVTNIDIDRAELSDKLLYNVDFCELKNDYIQIDGWAGSDDVNSDFSQIYLNFINSLGENKVIKAEKHYRKDVSINLNNENYLNSGFSIRVKSSDLPANVEQAQIILKTTNKALKSKNNYYIK